MYGGLKRGLLKGLLKGDTGSFGYSHSSGVSSVVSDMATFFDHGNPEADKDCNS